MIPFSASGKSLAGVTAGLWCMLVLGSSCLADETDAQKAGADTASAQEEPDVPLSNRKDGRYEWKLDHDPDGIGKFYMGREIAHVMGFQGAEWLERSTREEEERLTLLVKSINLKPGDVVADIGAGSGVISIRMSEAVLPGGSIKAVDVQQEMLDRLKEHCKTYDVQNVEPIKGTAKTTNLKPNSIDVALMVDVYHEFEHPYEMMLDISKAMKPGGRVIFVEYRKEDPSVPIKLVHKMTQAQVRREMSPEEFQLEWKETVNVLPRQHIIIFQKKAPKPEPQQ